MGMNVEVSSHLFNRDRLRLLAYPKSIKQPAARVFLSPIPESSVPDPPASPFLPVTRTRNNHAGLTSDLFSRGSTGFGICLSFQWRHTQGSERNLVQEHHSRISFLQGTIKTSAKPELNCVSLSLPRILLWFTFIFSGQETCTVCRDKSRSCSLKADQ